MNFTVYVQLPWKVLQNFKTSKKHQLLLTVIHTCTLYAQLIESIKLPDTKVCMLSFHSRSPTSQGVTSLAWEVVNPGSHFIPKSSNPSFRGTTVVNFPKGIIPKSLPVGEINHSFLIQSYEGLNTYRSKNVHVPLSNTFIFIFFIYEILVNLYDH